MSFKPLSCHLSPDDSHSLSGSHLKVYHAAITWIVIAAFVMAPSIVVSAEAVLMLGRWCIGEEIKLGTRIWMNKRGRLTVQGSSLEFDISVKSEHFHDFLAVCCRLFIVAERSRDRQK